jgi:hypothetical protein
MEPGAAALRQMRMVHAVFVTAVLLFVLEAELLARNEMINSPTVPIAIAVVAVLDVNIGYAFRRIKLNPALRKLRVEPNDSDALKQWRSSTMVSLVLALTVGFYGLVLRFLGAVRLVSWPFYLVALILFLVWRPQLDHGGEAANTGGAQ